MNEWCQRGSKGDSNPEPSLCEQAGAQVQHFGAKFHVALKWICPSDTHPDLTWVLTMLVRTIWTVTDHVGLLSTVTTTVLHLSLNTPLWPYCNESYARTATRPCTASSSPQRGVSREDQVSHQNAPDFPDGTPPVTPVSSVTCRCLEWTRQKTVHLWPRLAADAGLGWDWNIKLVAINVADNKKIKCTQCFRNITVPHSGCPTNHGKGAGM